MTWNICDSMTRSYLDYNNTIKGRNILIPLVNLQLCVVELIQCFLFHICNIILGELDELRLDLVDDVPYMYGMSKSTSQTSNGTTSKKN